MAKVRVEHLRKSFAGSQPVVDDLSLELDDGEILALLGPSGCGKTTTLRLIAGFLRPDAGRILIGGEVVEGPGCHVPPERRRVGMVFQDYALFPHLTVAANVAFGLRGLRGPAREARVAEMLRLVEMADYASRYPHQLSGGQQQRVALARALAAGPRVLLLDEPFSNLDPSLRDGMRREVRRILKAAGASAILVTHDRRDAFAIADRVAVLRDGRLEQMGTPEEVCQAPATPFVARFLGYGNLLDGIVVSAGAAGLAVDTALGRLACRPHPGVATGQAVQVVIPRTGFKVGPHGRLRAEVVSITHDAELVEMEVLVRLPGRCLSLQIAVPPADEPWTRDTYVYLELPRTRFPVIPVPAAPHRPAPAHRPLAPAAR